MDIPSDPGLILLNRLHNILTSRPFLIKMLKKYRPQHINMPTLLEILDTLKSNGVADIDIESYLLTPATQWK